MRSLPGIAIVVATLLVLPEAQAVGTRARLIEARNLAYDANYRNDQEGLRTAIALLKELSGVPQEQGYLQYYLAWTYWMLSASQLESKEMPAARDSAALAVEHAKLAVAARDQDPEPRTVLVNALTFLAILDKSRRAEIGPLLMEARRKALELGADNPRTVLMDAGMIFWAPPDKGGSRERGIERWHEALRLFEAEANAATSDTLAPRWGYALSYGWMGTNLLAMSPPRKDEAKAAAETGLEMRPDFWYARERVLARALVGTAPQAGRKVSPKASLPQAQGAASSPPGCPMQ